MRGYRLIQIGSLAFAFAGSVAAQLPTTGELAVNTLTTGNQLFPAVAHRPAGGFIVTWESDGADGSEFGCRFRRFTNAGVGSGAEAAVNDVTSFTQHATAVGTDAGGNFIVAWQTEVVQNDFGVAARRFAADGTPAALEVTVNGSTSGFQHRADIAVAPDDSFVVVWEDDGQQAAQDILLRTYNSSGGATSSEISVNQSIGSFRALPAVAMDGVGNFVVVWEAEVTGELHNVYARLFDAAGGPLTGEFRVNTTFAGNELHPDVARKATGEFIVVWESDSQDGNQAGVYGQRFTALGAPSGSEFRVNLRTAGNQSQPSVGLSSNGVAVVAFHDALLGLMGRAFDASGANFGGDFRINDPSPLDRTNPAIVVKPNGDFVVAWESYGQDGSGFGIRARMFEGSFLFRDGFESENTAAWTSATP